MKSSSISCRCEATLQGLLIGDTSVFGHGRADMGVQQSVTPFLPRGVGPQWEWQQWWCHQNGPWHDVLENDARLWGNCRFSKQWSMAAPLQAVHNSRQQRGKDMLKKIGNKGKEVYGFTINNETQKAFYTSWLAMQGYFCFSYYTPLGFFLIEF